MAACAVFLLDDRLGGDSLRLTGGRNNIECGVESFRFSAEYFGVANFHANSVGEIRLESHAGNRFQRIVEGEAVVAAAQLFERAVGVGAGRYVLHAFVVGQHVGAPAGQFAAAAGNQLVHREAELDVLALGKSFDTETEFIGDL